LPVDDAYVHRLEARLVAGFLHERYGGLAFGGGWWAALRPA
jgi:hypothetical protein